MLKSVYTFYSDGIPALYDLEECAKIAHLNDCLVQIIWEVFGYPHSILIRHTDTIEQIKAKMPSVYGG